MKNYIVTLLLLLLMAAIGLGCSSSANMGLVTPGSMTNGQSQADSNSERTLWGLYDIYMLPGTSEFEVVPLRTANFTANVNNLLEAKPGNLLIKDLDTTNYLTEGRIDCTVTLKHPLPGLKQYDGFDVWGVFMHNGTTPVGYDNLVYSNGSQDNEATMLNPDGYTRWYNYTEFSGTSIPILQFYAGKLADLKTPTATLNPYKIFADSLNPTDDYYTWITAPGNADNRGVFTAGSANSRRYELKFPLVGGVPQVHFQYAVVATWEPGDPTLTGDPATYEPGDFPSSANAEEAFFVNVSTLGSDLYYDTVNSLIGGTFKANIEVFDWQGGSVGMSGVPTEVNAIQINGNFLPGGTTTLDQTQLAAIASAGSENSSVFQVEIPNCTPISAGQSDLWVVVEAAGLNGASYGQGFPTPYPADKRRAAFLPSTVAISPNGPVVNDTYHVELDAAHSFDIVGFADFSPAILPNNDGVVYVMWWHNYTNTWNTTTDYATSPDSGISWEEPDWGAIGGFADSDDSMAGIDGVGDVYYLGQSHISYSWSAIVRFNPSYDVNFESGLYLTSSTYGRAFEFTNDGYAVAFGDYGDVIQCKKSLTSNSPISSGSWPGGWNTTPEFTVVPNPARLSKSNNIVRESDNSMDLVYFSPNATDTWINLAKNASGDGTTWTSGIPVYDGAADGYVSAHDPGLYLDSTDTLHSAFVLHKSSPSEMDSIAYTKSSDGTTWNAPVKVVEVDGTDVLNEVTLNIAQAYGVDFLVITYQNADKVYITFSWDDGQTWQTPVVMSPGTDSQPDMCVTSDGYVHTTYKHDPGTGDTSVDYIRAHFVKD